MATEFEKDTAKALVFSAGLAFDYEAFENTDLTESEQDEIIAEIQKFCTRGLKSIMKKHGNFDYNSTESIVDAIIYEDEN